MPAKRLRPIETGNTGIRRAKNGHVLVRDNLARRMKTRNGVRVLPLDGLTEEELSTLEALVGGRSPDCYLFYDALPTASQLRDHPVVARVGKLLRRISGSDRALHPQNLRHSFASLSTFGMLAADMRLEGSPYLEAWMRDSISASAPLFAGISGNLHRMGARGSALSMALGHISEDITFQHYTHVLDLLLFHACTAARMLERTDDGLLGLRRGEVKVINAAFKYHLDRGLETHGIESILRSAGKEFPEFFLVFRKPGRRKTSPATHHPITIHDLRAAAPNASARGYPDPKEQASLDTVHATIDRFNAAAMRNRVLTLSILDRWIERRMEKSDWAYFTPADAKLFDRDCSKLMPTKSLEIKWDHVLPRQRRHQRQKVTAAEFREALKSGRGAFHIRFSDSRAHVGSIRSKTQASVTWCCLAVRAVLGLA